MTDNYSVKKIVTLGPSSNNEECLEKMKKRGVDYVRVNMSHSTIEDLKSSISLAKKVGIPFMLDTQGSQIRTGDLKKSPLTIKEGSDIKIYAKEIKGTEKSICLIPTGVVKQLKPGDILRLDFNTLILQITNTSNIRKQYVNAKAISGGVLDKNKGVVVDTASGKDITLPILSPKDHKAIKVGLKEKVDHVLASFMRSGEAVEEVRRISEGKMKVISKIECTDALENLDQIIKKSDAVLIDRGDLSKEIPIERIPLTQKLIIHRAKRKGKGVIVATNLLETMIKEPRPTRAEVHDVINTIVDGATGLTLAAETAIGKYPIETINTLNRLIRHVEENVDLKTFAQKETRLVNYLEDKDYLRGTDHSSLVSPHGGKLINRMPKDLPHEDWVDTLPKIDLTEEQYMDMEQIAIGAFSPLEGFMTKKEVMSVLDKTRLPSGVIWPIPIILNVSTEDSNSLSTGDEVALYFNNTPVGIIYLEDKFSIDPKVYAKKLYGTLDKNHPGVAKTYDMKNIVLGGKIDLLKRRKSETKQHELTPFQTRNMFENMGWSKVVGFHTRNVIHRSHEFIQLKAMEKERCDGLFVHPVIGKKKPGDFEAEYIIKSYEKMIEKFYPKSKVVFGAFTTFSRYAGPREALFTAICRKNFGCSHFIVGRDHTGVGDFYHPHASHKIFDKFTDIGIVPVRFDVVFYSKKLKDHVHNQDNPNHDPKDKLHISGTDARKLLERGKTPPGWFMRKEIAEIIVDAIKKGKRVFVSKK